MDFETIEKRNEAKWHLLDGTIVEKDEIGGQFACLIRKATPGDLRRLSRKAKKSVFTGRRKQQLEEGDVLTRELLHFAVQDWVNLNHSVEVDGQMQKVPMPCSRENREKADDSWSEFSRMWQSAATGEFEEEEELGN